MELYAGSWNSVQNMPHRELLATYLEGTDEEKRNWILYFVGSYEEVGKGLRLMEEKRGSGVSPVKRVSGRFNLPV